MSEYLLSDRVRSGTDIMQRVAGGDRSALIELSDEIATLEQRVEKLEEAEIRVGADDEYVHGPLFHMERMHEGHIWFRIGDEAFDLYASDGTRLTWVPQASGGWEALPATQGDGDDGN